MTLRQPRSTRTDTLFPYTTLFRSHQIVLRAPEVGSALLDAALGLFRRAALVFDALDQAGAALQHHGDQQQGERAGQHRHYHGGDRLRARQRSEEHTSELQSLMRISYAVFCLKKKNSYRSNKHKS